MENAERFWSKVNKDGREDDEIGNCWEWTGCLNSDGYGGFGLNGKVVLAHRLSYALNHPDDDFDLLEHPEICVCHKCDNPKCVNPAHLFSGSMKDNMKDRDAKGRGNQAKGENHPLVKLTETQVREIRTRYANGGITQQQLALEYRVSQSSISDIIRRQNWSHI